MGGEDDDDEVLAESPHNEPHSGPSLNNTRKRRIQFRKIRLFHDSRERVFREKITHTCVNNRVYG